MALKTKPQMVAKTEGRHGNTQDIHDRRRANWPTYHLCLVSKKDHGHGGYVGGQLDDYLGDGYTVLSEELSWTGHPALALLGIPLEEWNRREAERVGSGMTGELGGAHIDGVGGVPVESRTYRGESQKLGDAIDSANASPDTYASDD